MGSPEDVSFVELCSELRTMGATEVTAGAYTAKFGSATPPAASVIRVPIGPQEPKRQPDERLELYAGEVLSDEDKARRREQQRIKDIVTGS